MTVPGHVLDFIRSHGKFLILGHKEPDGDCIASQLAFGRLIESLGKEYRLFSAGPFDRPEISMFEREFSPHPKEADLEGDPAVAILDCSTPERTGPPGRYVAGLHTLVIDHHASGEVFGDVRFIVPESPSTTLLVLSVQDALGARLSTELARLILFGLCTDTGFFRHLGPGAAETFRAVGRLVEAGTSTSEIFQMVYGKRDLRSRKLLAVTLGRTESRLDDRLLLTWQTLEDRRDGGGVYLRGEDELYRLLQTVKGNEVVVFIKQETEGRYSIGFRSNHGVDVGAIAAAFGGGGHKQAAGCDMTGSLESIKSRLIETLMPLLQK
jgi:phosphoesterase RecJ-like protein